VLKGHACISRITAALAIAKMINLEFVNNNEAIDKATRSRIRRHAATGLNVGRKINRPSRSKAPNAKSASCTDVEQQRQSGDSSHDGLERRLPLQRIIGDSVSVLDVPVRIAPDERWLVHNGWSALVLALGRVTLMATL
jgi:hypothetical protein